MLPGSEVYKTSIFFCPQNCQSRSLVGSRVIMRPGRAIEALFPSAAVSAAIYVTLPWSSHRTRQHCAAPGLVGDRRCTRGRPGTWTGMVVHKRCGWSGTDWMVAYNLMTMSMSHDDTHACRKSSTSKQTMFNQFVTQAIALDSLHFRANWRMCTPTLTSQYNLTRMPV